MPARSTVALSSQLSDWDTWDIRFSNANPDLRYWVRTPIGKELLMLSSEMGPKAAELLSKMAAFVKEHQGEQAIPMVLVIVVRNPSVPEHNLRLRLHGVMFQRTHAKAKRGDPPDKRCRFFALDGGEGQDVTVKEADMAAFAEEHRARAYPQLAAYLEAFKRQSDLENECACCGERFLDMADVVPVRLDDIVCNLCFPCFEDGAIQRLRSGGRKITVLGAGLRLSPETAMELEKETPDPKIKAEHDARFRAVEERLMKLIKSGVPT